MDDWQVGDLALCVAIDNDPGTVGVAFDVTVGAVYTVCEVCSEPADIYEVDWIGLNFEEDYTRDASSAWDAKCFRKIAPLTDEERDSFLADLDAPVSPAVPSDGRKVVALHNAGDGHTPTPAVALSATTLPEGARAPNREALSGLPINVAAHAAAQ